MTATITTETVLDAILRSDDTALDSTADQPTDQAEDFRTYAPEFVRDVDGEPLLITRCEEFVEDRWEPFVSEQRIPQAIRNELRI